MNKTFKLFDIIYLQKDIENIPRGSQGTIVHIYETGNECEIEFSKCNKYESIVLTVPFSFIGKESNINK